MSPTPAPPAPRPLSFATLADAQLALALGDIIDRLTSVVPYLAAGAGGNVRIAYAADENTIIDALTAPGVGIEPVRIASVPIRELSRLRQRASVDWTLYLVASNYDELGSDGVVSTVGRIGMLRLFTDVAGALTGYILPSIKDSNGKTYSKMEHDVTDKIGFRSARVGWRSRWRCSLLTTGVSAT